MTRRTIRRYAHELYPHPQEWEVRDLTVEVPYRYAIALGREPGGTGWCDLLLDGSPGAVREASERTMAYIRAAELAFLADAIHQGLTGQTAWEWAQERVAGGDAVGEWLYERATHYGVPAEHVKPYPCGPTPDHHDHMASTGNVLGTGIVTRAPGPEDECDACTQEDA